MAHLQTDRPLRAASTALPLSRWARLVALDDRILRRVCRGRSETLTPMLDGLCRVLDPSRVPLWICALIVAGAATFAETAAVTLILSSTVVVALKRAVRRARPHKALQAWVPPDRFSFPSGHTAAAFALAFAIAPLVSPGVFLVAVAIAALVGYARMALGVHYPLDVLAGATVGIAVGMLATVVTPAVQHYAAHAPAFL